MIRLFGAALVLVGSGWLAVLQEQERSAEIAHIRSWTLALSEMARQLEQCAAEMETLLRCGSTYIESMGSVDLTRLAQQDFNSLWKTMIQHENRQILSYIEPLGAVLGRYGQEEQRSALLEAARGLDALSQRLAAQQRQERRLRCTLWLSGGGALVVLLL